MEASAPVQQRSHGAAPTPTRRQRQAELRARELAAAGLEGRPHVDHLQVEHRHTSTARPATFAVPQASVEDRPTPSRPFPVPTAATPVTAPAPLAAAPAAAVAAAPRTSPFPPTGILRAAPEPAAPIRTPSGEIPVVLVPAPTPLRSTPTPVVAAGGEDAQAASLTDPVFPPLSRRERKSGAPATGATPVAPATPARGTLFGSRLVARAATGAAFVGALACVPMIIPGTASGDLAPGGQQADLADDEGGSTTTLANTAEDDMIAKAEALLARAEASSASTHELETARAELTALKDQILAERSEGSQRASRSNERTSLADSTEVADTTVAQGEGATGPLTAADLGQAMNNVAMQLNDFGEPSQSVVTPAPATPAELAADRRNRAATLLDQCGSANFSNGKIPASALTSLSFAPSQSLRCDAAAMLEELSDAYAQRFGTSIPLTDTYRSYSEQVSTRAAKPGLAAVPGTSNHGWGLAIDLAAPASSPGSAQYKWLRANAPLYGWDNPAWARPNGSKPEPWHFEYAAGW
ncbi:D-alanyl-D-alanine carboxypeptidase family protein [Oerskovia sp. NPDC057915]|uniref:M15 family metallopeptidase n=1 Tax=Oerskovia sp. NPDC057915 TaxID=3346280 RepID=UPI0036D764E5